MASRSKSATPKALGLSKENIRVIEKGGAKRLDLDSKTQLFSQGENADSIYYIIQGKVQITVVSKQGREGMIGFLSEGDFVGEASLTAQPLYLESAKVFADSKILKIPSNGMRDLIQKNASIGEYFTNFLLRRGMEVQADLVDHLFNSSEKRLARVLLLLANFSDKGEMEPILHITQEMLAERVGTTRARISFFMNKFRRLGLIEYNGQIKVHSGLLNVILNDARIAAND